MILGYGNNICRILYVFFAMMSIMFTKHSRFADLKRKLEVVKIKKIKTTIFRLLLSFNGFAQTHNHEHDAAGIMKTMLKTEPRE
jgi:hypothetical protein